jgi:CRP/FNR family transcriptional regulator, anaerobic regulatory protein
MTTEVNTEILHYLNNRFPFSNELKELIASVGIIKPIPKGEILIHAGQYLKHTALVVEGRMKLYRESEFGDEAFMYYLEPGNACALSMLCASRQKTSEITAKAVEDSIVVMIPIQYTDELMKYHKDWYNFVIETYRSRFEELLEVFDNVVFKSMDERLEIYLKNQFKSLDSNRLELTHQDIANDLNTSREVISRLLKKLEQRGEIVLNRKYIEKG